MVGSGTSICYLGRKPRGIVFPARSLVCWGVRIIHMQTARPTFIKVFCKKMGYSEGSQRNRQVKGGLAAIESRWTRNFCTSLMLSFPYLSSSTPWFWTKKTPEDKLGESNWKFNAMQQRATTVGRKSFSHMGTRHDVPSNRHHHAETHQIFLWTKIRCELATG